MNKKLLIIAVSLLTTLVSASAGIGIADSELGSTRLTRALSCSSPWRLLRPQLFAHCETCSYGSWSRWIEQRFSKSSGSIELTRTRSVVVGNAAVCTNTSEAKIEKSKIMLIYYALHITHSFFNIVVVGLTKKEHLN